MTTLILIFAFVCLLIAYAVARIAAWLYFRKHLSIAAVFVCTALMVLGIYFLTVLPPHFGTVFIALPFAIGFGEGTAALLVALFCQGLLTWILSLLFFWGICRLKKYDEEYEKNNKDQI